MRVVSGVLLSVVDCVAESEGGDEEDEEVGESKSKTKSGVDCEKLKEKGCVCTECAEELFIGRKTLVNNKRGE